MYNLCFLDTIVWHPLYSKHNDNIVYLGRFECIYTRVENRKTEPIRSHEHSHRDSNNIVENATWIGLKNQKFVPVTS